MFIDFSKILNKGLGIGIISGVDRSRMVRARFARVWPELAFTSFMESASSWSFDSV